MVTTKFVTMTITNYQRCPDHPHSVSNQTLSSTQNYDYLFADQLVTQAVPPTPRLPELAPTPIRFTFTPFNHFQLASLNSHQLLALCHLHEHGLRSRHLVNWQRHGYEFTHAHGTALINLIKHGNYSPAQAVAAISRLSEQQAENFANKALEPRVSCPIL